MSPQPTVSPQHFWDLNHLTLALQLGNFHSEMLDWGYFETRWWRNYLHMHSFFEICYAFEGQGLFRIQGREYQVHGGQIFIARPGEMHEIISSESDPLGIYFWSYTLTRRVSDPVDISQSDALLDAFCTGSCPVSTRTPAIYRTLELLTEEVARQEPGYDQSITALLAKLLLDTARAVVDLPSSHLPAQALTKGTDEAIVQTITRYLRDNYARPLTMREVAAQVHLSARHTNRLFHKVTGKSVMEYLSSLRLDIAAQRLLEHDLSIKEIAQMAGYPDARYFSTLFHKQRGMTPTAFRQQGGTRFASETLPAQPPR